MREVVVGVDGSAASRAALRWAVRWAELTGATVRAVTAWEYPAMLGWGPITPTEDFGEIARSVLKDTVEAVLGDAPKVTVRQVVVLGTPAQVLLDATKGGQTLVVGSRGRGGFAAALLGSVSQHVAHHATGTLVIVREPAETEGSADSSEAG